MRFKRFALFLIGTLLATVVSAQSITYSDQVGAVAPSSSGQTGLFTTVTGDMLRQGDWSFGIYLNNYDLSAGPARDFVPLSGREYKDMGYDHNVLSASLGYGLTDRWEVSAMLPWEQIYGNGRDRAGFINGHLYQGKFDDSGIGNLHLATKFGFMPADAPSHLAASLFVDVPTGDDDGGISSGNADWGAGLHWTRDRFSLAGTYKITGDRDSSNDLFDRNFDVPDEFHIDAGLNMPIGLFGATNWISEVNGIVYTGGERRPDNPIYLVTGLRHWFGTSGWALNAGVRWNVAKFADDNDECRFTELDDCALGGLVGLTYAPLHLAPPPPPPAPPAPPVPAPVAPAPEAPVAPPPPTPTVRTDEIHFEPGSARLTNIAKAILDDVALRMKQETSATAVVIGYTDNKESTGANADLDRRRAEAVRDYLVSRHGIDPSRISVEAHGTEDAIGDNSTAEGRLKNRRVVIRLTIP
jgi:outer membrane protein OmpA-like peptidoglycan-associated protein